MTPIFLQISPNTTFSPPPSTSPPPAALPLRPLRRRRRSLTPPPPPTRYPKRQVRDPVLGGNLFPHLASGARRRSGFGRRIAGAGRRRDGGGASGSAGQWSSLRGVLAAGISSVASPRSGELPAAGGEEKGLKEEVKVEEGCSYGGGPSSSGSEMVLWGSPAAQCRGLHRAHLHRLQSRRRRPATDR
ncbi:uncharacterized protein A4U43_C07F16850 [Asparagus officinalis]|uniref:Uncharacterized protein n=1 Tax=Asparagus officinalis TaxID=4686 RepID=A0A5P1ECM6_ASPOF|nr:uncharacterized protein A4U43_C07F16850 [Asparagus officinalis]